MSDLIDRKLKKMDQNVKYDQVPFDERHMKKMVLKSSQKKKQKQSHVGMKTLLIPTATILLFTGWQLSQNQQPPETAGLLMTKDTTPELKTAAGDPPSTFVKADNFQKHKTSMIVRETYVIHEDEQFFQTAKRVTPKELGEVIGTINHKNPGEKSDALESVTAFLPETKIYRIKGEENENRIVIRSWRSTGIGSVTASTQGYFVFEKIQMNHKEDS
ncbi:hypothetical protein LC065_03025 [Halobacillus litoralis]|uniref:hypothetical protein n=1 Tax=Halobacillus litoralis TaxID=45668 RepID=UPI001CFD49EA|nr:hypothetical protein [Halobacillus litoralis]WLR48242.1 hypothetical protein LC065_03025 [Halobacillus litoralis]